MNRAIDSYQYYLIHPDMYSIYLPERKVHLSKHLHGAALVNTLKEEGFKVSKSGVYYVINKYKKLVQCMMLNAVDDQKYYHKELIS